jgi:hypothetical protein
MTCTNKIINPRKSLSSNDNHNIIMSKQLKAKTKSKEEINENIIATLFEKQKLENDYTPKRKEDSLSITKVILTLLH